MSLGEVDMETRTKPPMSRDGIYWQVYRGALSVARRQSADVAAHAEDIAMNVVMNFTQRHMTDKVESPYAWGAAKARGACTNYANRQLAKRRAEFGSDSPAFNEHVDLNPAVYPLKMTAGADAVEFALACLSSREREIVRLILDGYSHAEVAAFMGYASARTVTTTLTRIRRKITDHVGGQGLVEQLLRPSKEYASPLQEFEGAEV